MQKKISCFFEWRSAARSGFQAQGKRRAGFSFSGESGSSRVGWADEAVGVRVERLWIILFLLKREVPTHQTAVGPLAGHACLTTGSESSPLLA